VSYRDHLRSEAAGLEVGDVLRSSPRVLIGVSSFAAGTLASMGINSVFDLATSSTFAGADLVIRAADDPASPEARVGKLPSDLFASPNGVALADAPALDVEALRALGGSLAGNVREALDVSSIRELALWPPYLAAREVLGEATKLETVGPEGTPGDLLPMSGRYATERSFYSTYVLADTDDPAAAGKQPLEDAGPLDPARTLQGTGFTRPARGARLTFSQSWFSEGVALGQLLHSLALAPGESTRVAMIDWSRQQTAMQREAEGQTEMLTGDITRKRALTEVQNAVATETQTGFSNTSATSRSMQGGGGAGIGIGALTLGGSFSAANAQSSSATVTGSSGVRNIAAAMSQNVADSTHQAASSARDRFASVVRELSQAEHEQLSTRVVANYNHMHALTMQYYEVVQIFRTVVGLHRFEPCLFVPMKVVDFSGGPSSFGGAADLLVRRFRAALQAAALDEQTRVQLRADALGLVRVQPTATNTDGSAIPRQALPADVEAAFERQTLSLRQQFGRDPVVRDGTAVELPDECDLTGVTFDFPVARIQIFSAAGAGSVELTAPAPLTNAQTGKAAPVQIPIVPSIPIGTVTGFSVDTANRNVSGVMTLSLSYRGVPIQVPLGILFPQTPGFQSALRITQHEAPQVLLRHLEEEKLYYSQAIWRAMDPAAIATLLAPYSYAGLPLAQVVDPAPIDVSGNFLIFRMPWEARDLVDLSPQEIADATAGAAGSRSALTALLADTDWVQWVTRHADFRTTVEDLVPLPSGGVFAEAVLGRANSAEKLDITRFWNWQDSPIPLQAPDIAALQAGSRARDDTTTPSGFAAPVVAFNNPPALPDPAGLSGVLGAVANGNLFRDMSGSAATQALALAALQGTGAGATAAGAQAGANLAVAAQKEIELAKLAAGIVTGGLAGGGPTGTISEQGAKINEGRSLDERGVPAGGGTPAGDATPAPDGGSANGTTPARGAHEVQAAEGPANRVLDLASSLIGRPRSTGSTAAPPAPSGSATPPPAGSGSSSGGTTPAPKPPAPTTPPSSGSGSGTTPASKPPPAPAPKKK
jgi:hypothetical protein